ncbi:MAG: hypothetical protein HRU38_06655 [Saccharospirillaceae bacterium]|nr:hypothetical protein [Pseudomonadales bacterium]NRB78334.1 hypothetical protein [Saccharospirillaceae bacterium]
MKIIISLMTASLLMVGCSKETTNKSEGFWISDDNSYILEITKEQTSFTFLNKSVASTKDVTICANIEMDKKSVTINCALTKNLDFKMVVNDQDQLITTREDMPGFLKRAPNVKIQDLIGTWKDKESNGSRSTIYVTNQRESDYVLETFDIYEKSKKYYYSKKEYKNTFSEGFKFTEQLEESESVFYIVEFTKDWYRAVDQTGYSWNTEKYEGDMNKDLQAQGYQLIK